MQVHLNSYKADAHVDLFLYLWMYLSNWFLRNNKRSIALMHFNLIVIYTTIEIACFRCRMRLN